MRRRHSAPANYAERTYGSPYWLIRYAHRRRFELMIALALECRPEVVVDYGAGEGEMLLSMLSDPRCPATLRAIAFEPWSDILAEHLERRSADDPTDRVELAITREEVEDRSCDVITCAEVLEHLTLAERHRFYAFVRRTLRPGGRVIVGVPVELGPSVLIKNFGRRVLKADKREYTLRETLQAASGFTVFDPRRYDPRLGDEYITSHKGFDFRLLRKEMGGQGMTIEKTITSPMTWLPAYVANQEVIIVASLAPPQD